MKNNSYNWDDVPEILSKEQVRILGHMSKATTLYFLQSGKLPCIYSGKKTRCYRIRKSDFITFLESRDKYPELYSAPEGWYAGNVKSKTKPNNLDDIAEDLHGYYTYLFEKCADVLTVKEISDIIEYDIKTINKWCCKDYIKHFSLHGKYHIPKVYLVDFLCTKTFRTISKKATEDYLKCHEK